MRNASEYQMTKVRDIKLRLADENDPIFNKGFNVSSHNKSATDDPVLELMEKYEIEMTRENYIYYSFMGDVPEELDTEFLASIPKHLSKD